MMKKNTKVLIGLGLDFILQEDTPRFILPFAFLFNGLMLLLWTIMSIPFLIFADEKNLVKEGV